MVHVFLLVFVKSFFRLYDRKKPETHHVSGPPFATHSHTKQTLEHLPHHTKYPSAQRTGHSVSRILKLRAEIHPSSFFAFGRRPLFQERHRVAGGGWRAVERAIGSHAKV